MYLKGSKWSMNRKRTRPNWFRIILLSLLVLGGAYMDRFIHPDATSIRCSHSHSYTHAPESFITEAEELFKQGKLLQSIEAYKQAIAVSPENASYYISLARDAGLCRSISGCTDQRRGCTFIKSG